MTDFADVIAYLRIRADHERSQAKVLEEAGYAEDAEKTRVWAARLDDAAIALGPARTV